MNNEPNFSTVQTKKMVKPLSVLIYCVLIFVMLFTSCSAWFVSNNPNYMYALIVQKIFYQNEDSFKKVVDYIRSLDLPTTDSLTLYPNSSSNIDSNMDEETIKALNSTECKEVVYYHRTSSENFNIVHIIEFNYCYGEDDYPTIEYSSNDLDITRTVFDAGTFYYAACIDLDDNWRLYYQSNKECKT